MFKFLKEKKENHKKYNNINYELDLIFNSFKYQTNKQEERIYILKKRLYEIKNQLINLNINYFYKNKSLNKILDILELMELSNIKDGLNINAILLNNPKLKEIGIVLSKEGIRKKIYFNNINWFEKEYNKYSQNIIFEDNNFIAMKINLTSPLIYISNLTFNIKTNKIYYKRNLGNNIETKKFYLKYISNLKNKDRKTLKTLLYLNKNNINEKIDNNFEKYFKSLKK